MNEGAVLSPQFELNRNTLSESEWSEWSVYAHVVMTVQM